MIDYTRKKAVLYPIDADLFDKLDDEIEEPFYLDVFSVNTKLNCYLCYELYHTYGEESTGFGMSRMLTQDETKRYVELFSDYLNNIDPNKFKWVDYCYNSCVCGDYYKGQTNEPKEEQIKEEPIKGEPINKPEKEPKENLKKEKHLEYWNDVLVQASIAAMQGLQESGHLLSVAADVLPKELAELSVKIAKCLVSKLKEEIGE